MNAIRVLFAGAVLVSGVSLAANTVYKNTKYGFALSYPGTWENVKAVKGSIVAWFREAKPVGGFATSVNVTVTPLKDVQYLRESDLDPFGDAILKVVSADIAEFKLIKRSHTTLGGQPAFAYTFTGKASGMELQGYNLSTIYKSKGYTLYFTTRKNTYAQFEKTFNAIKNSFKLL